MGGSQRVRRRQSHPSLSLSKPCPFSVITWPHKGFSARSLALDCLGPPSPLCTNPSGHQLAPCLHSTYSRRICCPGSSASRPVQFCFPEGVNSVPSLPGNAPAPFCSSGMQRPAALSLSRSYGALRWTAPCLAPGWWVHSFAMILNRSILLGCWATNVF